MRPGSAAAGAGGLGQGCGSALVGAGFIVPLGLAHGVGCHQIKGWLRLEGLWGQDTCPGGETQTRHGNNCLGLLTPGQGGQVAWGHADSSGDT